MTTYENVQKAESIIKRSSASINWAFEKDGILTERELGTALQQSKNITGWIEYLMSLKSGKENGKPKDVKE